MPVEDIVGVAVKNGVVYTKPWVANFILDIVGYKDAAILSGRIIEPSCGKGVFLLEIAKRISDAVILNGRSWTDIIDCVSAYDISVEDVNYTRNIVYCELIRNRCPSNIALEISQRWVTCGDFLSSVVEKSDWIVGNPPYIRAGHIDRENRAKYVNTFFTMTEGCDIYIAFIEKSLSLMKDGGGLCFVCSDRWTQNSYGKKLRSFINNDNSTYNHELLMRMHDVDIFNDKVNAYASIIKFTKNKRSGKIKYINCSNSFSGDCVTSVFNWINSGYESSNNENFQAAVVNKSCGADIYSFSDNETCKFLNESKLKCEKLGDSTEIGIGIATGCDSVFITKNIELVEEDRLLPLFYMRDEKSGKVQNQRWLVNPWDSQGKLVNLKQYPRLCEYFESNRKVLERRYVARKNSEFWYRTIDKVKFSLLEKKMLLIPDMAKELVPVLSKGKYPHHNCYWVTSDKWDLEVLGGLLMSKNVRCFFEANGVKMRGNTFRFQAQYLKVLPVPSYEKINMEIRNGLVRAFRNRDFEEASKYAELAYSI